MQGRWTLALVLSAFATLSLGAPAQATHLAPTLAVNVVEARDLGCSDDVGDTADLRVSVYLDDRLALRTVKAQGQAAPWFGNVVAVSDPGRPFQVTIRVEEAEPGGAFLLGTDWVTCDVSPGAPSEFVTTWSGGVQAYVARGDAHAAAEATVVIGPGAPTVPTLQAVAGEHSLDLAWAAVAGTPGVAAGWLAEGDSLAPGATSHRLEGLCDGDWHSVRLAVRSGAWHVAGPAQAWQTTDLAPQAARVLSAASATDGWRVEWESRTTHDVGRYEVLVGPDPDAPPAIARGSLKPFSDWSRQSTTVPSAAGDAYAWVRTVDRGGHSATSAAFALGSPAQAPGSQQPWTQLDPCIRGAAVEPAFDPNAPEVAKDVFASEAGHPASDPSSPSGMSASSSTASPPITATHTTSEGLASTGPVGLEDGSGGSFPPAGEAQRADGVVDGSAAETAGWIAVVVVGLALFVTVLALVTRLGRR